MQDWLFVKTLNDYGMQTVKASFVQEVAGENNNNQDFFLKFYKL